MKITTTTKKRIERVATALGVDEEWVITAALDILEPMVEAPTPIPFLRGGYVDPRRSKAEPKGTLEVHIGNQD